MSKTVEVRRNADGKVAHYVDAWSISDFGDMGITMNYSNQFQLWLPRITPEVARSIGTALIAAADDCDARNAKR